MARTRTRRRLSNRLLWALQTSVALFAVWMALDGLGTLWLGAILAVIGAAAGAWLVPGEAYPWRPLRLLHFALYFVRQSVVGGVDVAWRALSPTMPIAPTFTELAVDLPPGLPRTLLVATISLVPGTLAVQLRDDGTLEVHALTPRAADGLPHLQRHIERLFSLDRREGAA
jgi:multicomponent Na+:H+ antiporter subunit E